MSSEEPPVSGEEEASVASEVKDLEARIELLVNVAMLTIMTLMRLIKDKGPDAIGEPEMEQFNKVKESVQMAVTGLEEWQADIEAGGMPFDLTRIRAKLELLTRKIDQWPKELAAMDSTPPS